MLPAPKRWRMALPVRAQVSALVRGALADPLPSKWRVIAQVSNFSFVGCCAYGGCANFKIRLPERGGY